MEQFRTKYIKRCQELHTDPHYAVLEQTDPKIYQKQSCSPSRKEHTSHTSQPHPDKHAPLYPHRLNLSGQNLSIKCVNALSESLQDDSVFTEILLADSFLGDEGCLSLTNGLRTNRTVERLDLRSNNIRVDGAIAISQLLKVTTTIKHIGIWEAGPRALGEALAINASLLELDLRNNKIGPQGCVALTKGLKHNSTLKRLDLRWNSIGLCGGRAILDTLKWNSTLTDIDLTGNEVPDDIAKGIALALEHNQSRHQSNETSTSRYLYLDRELQNLQIEHQKQTQKLVEETEKKAMDYETQRTNWAIKLDRASTEIEKAQVGYRMMEKKYREAENHAQNLHNKVQDLETTLVHERGEHSKLVETIQKDLIAERELRSRSDDDKRHAISDITKRLLSMESQFRECELKVELANRDKNSLVLELENERKEHRNLEAQLQQSEATYSKRLRLMEDLKSTEYRKLQEDYNDRLKKMEDRLRNIESARVRAEEELDSQKAKSLSQKILMEEKIKETEQRVRADEDLRHKEIENQFQLVKKQKDQLQSDFDSHLTRTGHLSQEYENKITKERDARLFAEEAAATAKSEAARLSTDTQRYKAKWEEVNRAEQTLNEKVAKLTTELSGIHGHYEERLREANETVMVKDREVSRWREEARIKENELNKIHEEEAKRLSELENAISSYIRGSKR